MKKLLQQYMYFTVLEDSFKIKLIIRIWINGYNYGKGIKIKTDNDITILL